MGGTCKCHADMLIQGTYLTNGPLLLQLCDRFLLNTEDNYVFSSDSHLYRKKYLINFLTLATMTLVVLHIE